MIYYAGRGLSVASFIGIMLLLCFWGRHLASERAVWLSLILFALAPVSGAMGTISKPHLPAAFLVLLGVFCLQLYLDKGRFVWVALGGVILGLAVGCSICCGPRFHSLSGITMGPNGFATDLSIISDSHPLWHGCLFCMQSLCPVGFCRFLGADRSLF